MRFTLVTCNHCCTEWFYIKLKIQLQATDTTSFYCIFQVGCQEELEIGVSIAYNIIGNHYTRILGVGHYSGPTKTLLSLSSMDE